jgi:hypothetical protein
MLRVMLLPNVVRATLASALLLSAFVASAGCSSTTAQPAARDQATKAGCDLADKCGAIGDGKQYVTRDDCESSFGGSVNEAWPAEDCTNIKNDALDACIKAIDNTQCGNLADLLNTFANKCSKASVCGGDAG